MMEQRSRRNALTDVPINAHTHAGLWLDRYLVEQTGLNDDDSRLRDRAKEAKRNLVSEIDTTCKLPEGYLDSLLRRLTLLRDVAPGQAIRFRIFQSMGRMAVGLGQAGVLENGMTLDHTWGVPFLPGPSLKGVTAAAAHKLLEDESWRKETDATTLGASAKTLFGSVENAGCVHFLDGWYLPKEGDVRLPLHADVITTHNRSYYQSKTGGAPDGKDSPVPVSFLSASGDYVVAVAGTQEADEAGWLEAALEILTLGLERLGIGSKTNAGYGRLKPATTDHGWHLRVHPPRPLTPREQAERHDAVLFPNEAMHWIFENLNPKQAKELNEVDAIVVTLIREKYREGWQKGTVDRGNLGKEKFKERMQWLDAYGRDTSTGGATSKDEPGGTAQAHPDAAQQHPILVELLGQVTKEKLKDAWQSLQDEPEAWSIEERQQLKGCWTRQFKKVKDVNKKRDSWAIEMYELLFR